MDLKSIRESWQSHGVSIRKGLSEDAIATFEHRYSIRLPDALRGFYKTMDGMDYGSADAELISFWPLSVVGPVPETLSGYRGIPDYGGIESSLPDAPSYFVFADHSIWAHVYAVRLSTHAESPSRVVWIGGGTSWQEVASSFEEFMDRYAADPQSILFP